MLKNKKVILGVTASIAAYKSAFIIRELKKAGAFVKVIQTDASLDFVTPLTLSTLSENTVQTKIVEKDTKEWNTLMNYYNNTKGRCNLKIYYWEKICI